MLTVYLWGRTGGTNMRLTWTRRAFLRSAAGAVTLPWLAPPELCAAEADLIHRGDPAIDNLEFPFHTLKDFRTPTEQHYVRNHFAAAKVDVKEWKLQVVG